MGVVVQSGDALDLVVGQTRGPVAQAEVVDVGIGERQHRSRVAVSELAALAAQGFQLTLELVALDARTHAPGACRSCPGLPTPWRGHRR